MKRKICFTGHRPNKTGGYSAKAKDTLVAFATELLSKRIEIIEEAYVGMALGWDTATALACIALGIPFIACVPFKGQELAWPKESQDEFNYILSKAKEVIYVCDNGYAAWKMQKRNEFMVDNTVITISLWDGTSGGTGNCVAYAKSKTKPVVNVWDLWVMYNKSRDAAIEKMSHPIRSIN